VKVTVYFTSGYFSVVYYLLSLPVQSRLSTLGWQSRTRTWLYPIHSCFQVYMLSVWIIHVIILYVILQLNENWASAQGG
jgi:hypothetical protein